MILKFLFHLAFRKIKIDKNLDEIIPWEYYVSLQKDLHWVYRPLEVSDSYQLN